MSHRIKVKKGDNEIELEGSQEFVESKFDELKEIILGTLQNDGSNTSSNPITILDVHDLVTNLKPETNLDTQLIFAYFLYKENVDPFRVENIESCFHEARMRPPRNISRDLSELEKGGLLLERQRVGRFKTYTISTEGISNVESMIKTGDIG